MPEFSPEESQFLHRIAQTGLAFVWLGKILGAALGIAVGFLTVWATLGSEISKFFHPPSH
jgi:hypothetical protein